MDLESFCLPKSESPQTPTVQVLRKAPSPSLSDCARSPKDKRGRESRDSEHRTNHDRSSSELKGVEPRSPHGYGLEYYPQPHVTSQSLLETQHGSLPAMCIALRLTSEPGGS
uniref:Uncharacterized protein n=1 Tax=Timema shepardi TaxID=629360 RepID=A0A7R9G1K0_TIMSH|nr:unnamed protein product [Timema shepardi]